MIIHHEISLDLLQVKNKDVNVASLQHEANTCKRLKRKTDAFMKLSYCQSTTEWNGEKDECTMQSAALSEMEWEAL